MNTPTTRWMTGGALIALALCPGSVRADDAPAAQATYTRDILPILQKNCQGCHRPDVTTGGSTAPMTFMSYEETRPWAKAIAKTVKAGLMPPWHAAPEFHGVFANERGLTADEIARVQQWAAAGAPLGNPADAPAPAVFPGTGWQIGEPDLVVLMPEKFKVSDELEDQYKNFVTTLTEEQLPEDRWIKAIECRPGSTAVHHIIMYNIDPNVKGQEKAQRSLLGGIAPGNEPSRYPEGTGKLLKKGSRLVFAMHYHKTPGPGTATEDQSSIAVKFYGRDEKVTHQVTTDALGNYGFEIPPGHPNWEVGSARVFERDTTILNCMPHMHLRGKDAKYTAFYPDGTKEVLLYVPRYDFNWQTSYWFKEPKRIPAGTRVEVTMHFDNSTNNAANPDSAKAIHFGGPTTDEMMLGWLDYTDTNPEPAKLEVGDGAETGEKRIAGRN